MMRTARFEVAMGGGKKGEDVGVRACMHVPVCMGEKGLPLILFINKIVYVTVMFIVPFREGRGERGEDGEWEGTG